ncbi:expressed unknown protein [Ectocarpus siliculosus]|uniref:Uncharacterized protein n=1 Tax=Ectocarpus siliculosus TaxID=2880 RepID=D7G990_ECTSI|nr:expressed unknown protein [Ectocarpus siliculosus]|eukprot:CBJ34086.1 expressed unknown protein [Ectocarpus siliculosus]
MVSPTPVSSNLSLTKFPHSPSTRSRRERSHTHRSPCFKEATRKCCTREISRDAAVWRSAAHYGLVLPYGSGLTEELQAATLQLREDGTLSDIEETYLDPSAVCVPVTTSEEESSNMTVSDVSGVFFVLGFFVIAATVSWCFRRSPWAKRAKERRRLEKGGAAEQSVMDSYAKMSRGQQKAFAMQATVNLLQHSRELSASSKTLMEGISEGAKKVPDAAGGAAAAPPNPATGDAGGGREGGGRRAAPGEAEFRREMAEGRPVVGIGGGMGDSDQGFTRRAPSLSGLLSRLPGRRGGGGAGGDGGNPTPRGPVAGSRGGVADLQPVESAGEVWSNMARSL